jgi:CO/xanthine dehydrogenase Mo-binding subunit
MTEVLDTGLTNKTPAATYRAPGRFEGTFVRERLLDAITDRLGLDRVAVRRRNLITAREMPFARPLKALGTEIVYDSGDYPLLLDKALAKIGWDSLQADLRRRRAAGELVGSGIAIFVEKGGLGPLDRSPRYLVLQAGLVVTALMVRAKSGNRLWKVSTGPPLAVSLLELAPSRALALRSATVEPRWED